MTSHGSGLDAVVKRLERVERQNRRMKIIGTMVLVLVGSGLLMAQTKPKKRIVEAEQFVLQDASGRARGIWAAEKDGPTTLAIFDKVGMMRGVWGVAQDGPGLTLIDKDGKIAYKADWTEQPRIDLLLDELVKEQGVAAGV